MVYPFYLRYCLVCWQPVCVHVRVCIWVCVYVWVQTRHRNCKDWDLSELLISLPIQFFSNFWRHRTTWQWLEDRSRWILAKEHRSRENCHESPTQWKEGVDNWKADWCTLSFALESLHAVRALLFQQCLLRCGADAPYQSIRSDAATTNEPRAGTAWLKISGFCVHKRI